MTSHPEAPPILKSRYIWYHLQEVLHLEKRLETWKTPTGAGEWEEQGLPVLSLPVEQCNISSGYVSCMHKNSHTFQILTHHEPPQCTSGLSISQGGENDQLI